MMKKTLLEIVQGILSSMDSDEVNSISDTTESLQVARIVQDTYEDIIARADVPEHWGFFELEASGSVDKPTQMTIPSNVLTVKWIKYNCMESGETSPVYDDLYFVELEDFLRRMYLLNSDDSEVEKGSLTSNSETFDLFWYNDRWPSYYTTFDDHTLIFDAYKQTVDSTLQKSKTMCYGQLEPSFTFSDSFTPDLDAKHFAILINEAKVQAFAELKQSQNAVAERRARNGWINLQRAKQAIPNPFSEYDRLPNYGRKR